jgi:Na+/proline symporter
MFQYLQLRFNRSVRVMASVLCTIGMLFYIPIVMYVPALALSQGTLCYVMCVCLYINKILLD